MKSRLWFVLQFLEFGLGFALGLGFGFEFRWHDVPPNMHLLGLGHTACGLQSLQKWVVDAQKSAKFGRPNYNSLVFISVPCVDIKTFIFAKNGISSNFR